MANDVLTIQSTRPLVDERWRLLAWLIVLNVADLVTTMLVLLGGGREHNPVMQPFVEEWWSSVLIKATVLGIIFLLLVRCCELSSTTRLALVAANLWYLGVLVWNLVILTML